MSFLEILKKARESALKKDSESYESKKDLPEKTLNEVNKVIDEKIENKTDIKPDGPFITIGGAIIKQSQESLIKYKLLKRGTNASLRIAKALSNKKMTVSQLKKAFKIQERYNDKRADFHIVGSYALLQLREQLEKGVALKEALLQKYEEKIDE